MKSLVHILKSLAILPRYVYFLFSYIPPQSYFVSFMYLVLTQGAWCTRITNVSVRTCTNWLMHDYSAICVSCTWVPFSTRVNALPIFTCCIIRAISVTATTNKHIRWLHYIYKVFHSVTIIDQNQKCRNQHTFATLRVRVSLVAR